ncbi:hypothetical protein PRIPAC_97929 [Pristionchus pacificus]|uniref:G protein-coupled receptor n=1 Tax=Pristionchus pacificus TaxID=54126 RepID=A0A2A6D2V5_PRIPA|nr:hypothetical protein PRIPAC_97929 [Pristionchus pacificus]|eukprot:PDM84812.1 G protein-coupled receptor [Pristionchus pacificus]
MSFAVPLGIILNTLLLYLISRYSKPQLGNYRILLKIFASYEIFMALLHAIVQPASFTSGSALGVFSRSWPSDKQLIAGSSGCMTVPFTLMNINFLHRNLSVRRYAISAVRLSINKIQHSPCRAILQTSVSINLFDLSVDHRLFVVSSFAIWKRYCASISLADNEEGKAILRQSLAADQQGIAVSDGWLILHFWKQGNVHIRGLVTLLCGALIILVNLSIGATLCSLTIFYLQTEKTFSDNYRVYQFKILLALFAQSAIPILVMYCPTGVGLVIPLFYTTQHRALDNIVHANFQLSRTRCHCDNFVDERLSRGSNLDVVREKA